jgi:predicted Rossmann fold nucleotide-binding protein DprA/Smf involved in DNA uptake
LQSTLNSLKSKISTIISGGAIGADKLAERYALQYNIKIIIYKPD